MRYIITILLLFLGAEVALSQAVHRGNQVTTAVNKSRGKLIAAGGSSGSVEQWEYYEWETTDATWSGNAFDVVAEVTFTHTATSETRTTQMFYVGSNTWKWRFNGSRQGDWTYTTVANGTNGTTNDADLHGLTGSITVTSQPDANKEGFLVPDGNQYAIQTGDDATRGYVFTVWVNLADYPDGIGNKSTNLTTLKTDAKAFLDNAKANGTEVVQWFMAHGWLSETWTFDQAPAGDDPDPLSFDMLEAFIDTVWSSGGRVHIWYAGDPGNGPNEWTGGINGTVDQRVQRYIAARLGPIAGWSMGYGYDLNEYTGTKPGIFETWANYLQDRMGWDHVLAARAYNLDAVAGPTLDSYESVLHSTSLQTSSTGGPTSYAEVKADIDSDVSHPVFYEERHVYNRWANVDMQGTRRLLWWGAMAGGAGNFIGRFAATPVYPNPEQLVTHYEFWHTNDRFDLDYVVDNTLSGGTQSTGLALRNSTHSKFVFYIEGASAIDIDLTGASGTVAAVKVDLTAAYAETDISGLLAAGQDNVGVNLVSSSDWVIYIEVQ